MVTMGPFLMEHLGNEQRGTNPPGLHPLHSGMRESGRTETKEDCGGVPLPASGLESSRWVGLDIVVLYPEKASFVLPDVLREARVGKECCRVS